MLNRRTFLQVHCWSDRPRGWWPQPVARPTETPPVPPSLDWNLWLGCAPVRPYHPAHHPAKWRGFFDFGNGAVGDMAVHNLDPAFYTLDLDAPAAAEAQTSPPQPEAYPEWVKACKDRRPEDAKAGFAYFGPFVEALLVGMLAVRLQKRIEWDAAEMKARNAPEANKLIRKSYRSGFGIDGSRTV